MRRGYVAEADVTWWGRRYLCGTTEADAGIHLGGDVTVRVTSGIEPKPQIRFAA
jgi:hypothetical protein